MEKLLSTKELAELLGVKLNTLHVWRKRGVGPRSVNVGYRVKYRPSDVDAWLDEHASPSIQRTEDTRPGVVARPRFVAEDQEEAMLASLCRSEIRRFKEELT